MAERALEEVGAVFAALTPAALDSLVEETLAAKRVALYGVGREGLMVKAFAMRLFHLGCDAHVVGDMTTPPLGPGDLLVVSAGPGAFSTVLALMGVAKEAGARTLVVTAQPGGEAARRADAVVHVPAQTMADELAGPADVGPAGDSADAGPGSSASSVLPMGSLYETALLLLFEFAVIALRERLGQTPETMRARHTNLE